MAGNGDAQRLEQVERAVMGALRPDSVEATNSTTNSTSDDVMGLVDVLAERVREGGRYAKDHGAYLDEISTAFADKLRSMTAEYTRNMLAAEERRMAEVRRMLGKIGPFEKTSG